MLPNWYIHMIAWAFSAFWLRVSTTIHCPPPTTSPVPQVVHRELFHKSSKIPYLACCKLFTPKMM